MKVVEVNNVVKKFGNVVASNNISFDVAEDRIFGLIGPNGAGKTTMIRMITNVIMPDEGEIKIFGEHINYGLQNIIGYLPEERGLYKKLKVIEQLAYFGQLKGMARREALAKGHEWLEKLDIANWADKKIEELSKGMQQKVQFIVTVLHQPKLLIFDEPFSGFDPINVNILKDEIRYLNQQGATIIFSTHNMASVEEICDHITLIDNSRNVLSGEIHSIKEQFKTHIFNVAYRGTHDIAAIIGTDDFRVTENKKQRDVNKADIQLLNGKTPNDLLLKLLPHVEVVAMQEVLPSLNDIFIKVVNENKPVL